MRIKSAASSSAFLQAEIWGTQVLASLGAVTAKEFADEELGSTPLSVLSIYSTCPYKPLSMSCRLCYKSLSRTRAPTSAGTEKPSFHLLNAKQKHDEIFSNLLFCFPSNYHQPSSSSFSGLSPAFLFAPVVTGSLRMGILIPWLANDLLRSVLSITPGNFFALKTLNGLLKIEANTGAVVLVTVCEIWPLTLVGVPEVFGWPTLTKFNLSRNQPSVRTLRSWRTNQMPKFSFRSFNLNALALRLPMRFRVKAPRVSLAPR